MIFRSLFYSLHFSLKNRLKTWYINCQFALLSSTECGEKHVPQIPVRRVGELMGTETLNTNGWVRYFIGFSTLLDGLSFRILNTKWSLW